ncbi:ABC transporter ATP-binding protein [candidate division KSB1 bacterium]|nr:ABC transporter ATP-binding protein [candidate division KSB1 bacterium]MBL7093513.1 ABC transporter ATP-binding protein [candidate division KSB1 bacterium]
MNDIEIINFKKSYGDVNAVNGINLQVKKGELFGLIGPDGAGKTTLMRTICTLLLPDAGSIQVKGMDVTQNIPGIRALLGYMPQRFSLYQDLTVEQNLNFFADLFQVPQSNRESRLQQLFQFSKLEPFKKRAAGDLSGGMKQKLALSCALIHTPEILVLDEPTFGVDPVSRQEFWEILHSIRAEGTTILVSTAYMDEADLCDRVALFFSGQIKAVDTPLALRKNFKFPLYRLQGKNLRQLRDFFDQISGIHTTQTFGDSLHVSFSGKQSESQWQAWQKKTGGNLVSWQVQEPSIEDVFLDLIK